LKPFFYEDPVILECSCNVSLPSAVGRASYQNHHCRIVYKCSIIRMGKTCFSYSHWAYMTVKIFVCMIAEIARNCDASACDSMVTSRCPSDSVLVFNSTQEETACCRTTYECRCNPAVCKVPKCSAGHTPQIVHHSKQRPGACCDMYQCQPLGELYWTQAYAFIIK